MKIVPSAQDHSKRIEEVLRTLDLKSNQIGSQKEVIIKSEDVLVNIRDFKKCCKTCKEADQYTKMKIS